MFNLRISTKLGHYPNFISPSLHILNIKGGHKLIVLEKDKPQNLTESEIRELQTDVAQIAGPRLNTRVERVFPHWKGAKGHVWDKAAKICTEWAALIGIGEESSFTMRGKTHDIFLNFLLLLLMQTPAQRIRRCPAPLKRNPKEECGKLFLRKRRGIYCSTTCEERAGKQARRKKTTSAKPPEQSEENKSCLILLL
jgi:hypothetical protein